MGGAAYWTRASVATAGTLDALHSGTVVVEAAAAPGLATIGRHGSTHPQQVP